MKRPRKASIERVKGGYLVVLSHPGCASGTIVHDLDEVMIRTRRFLKLGATKFERDDWNLFPSAHREEGMG